MAKPLIWLLLVLGISSPALAAAPEPDLYQSQNCLPQFPYQQGWLGADAAYSIPLDPQRSLWLFGDTFIGQGDDRRSASMIANSIAISDCTAGQFNLKYFWNTIPSAKASAFFQPPSTSAVKFWPLHGVIVNQKIYVALEEITTEPVTEQNPFGFTITGVKLAEISNYQQDPAQWQVRYLPLAQSRTVIPGAAMVKQGDYLYLFGFLEKAVNQLHPLVLHRIPLNGLENPTETLEYLTEAGQWKPGLSGPDQAQIVKQGATELSVHYDDAQQKWLMVHTAPQFLSTEIVLQEAKDLSGPWQKSRSLPFYQEMFPNHAIYNKNTFCYAAKAHPQYKIPADPRLVVTYACNSFDFGQITRQMKLYFPVVRPLPQ